MANEFRVGTGIQFSDGTVQTTASSGGSSTITIQNKTAAYTVLAGDLGTIINCTSGTFTVSLTAAATLGAGFNCSIWNTSTTATDVITIDPDASETIEGKITHTLRVGEGVQIVCTGSAWLLGGKRAMRGYAENIPGGNAPVASGNYSVALGGLARAIGVSSFAAMTGSNSVYGAIETGSIAIGPANTASGIGSVSIGNTNSAGGQYSSVFGGYQNTSSGYASAVLGGTNSSAIANYSIAIGAFDASGSVASGLNSTSIGGSYAAGNGSFAAAITNNTSTYGAAQANSIAIGYNAKCGGNVALALGYRTNVGGSYSVGIGYGATTTAAYSIAISADYSSKASAIGGVAIGTNALAATVGKYAYSGSYFYGEGSAQTGTYVLSAETSTAQTTARLRTNTALADSTNQVILPNNSAYAFTGTVVARQQSSAGTQSAAWQLKGLIRREGTAGSTTLVTSILEVIGYPSSTWAVSLAADTTNGGLAINVTGPTSAGNLRWVATVQTTEVIYT